MFRIMNAYLGSLDDRGVAGWGWTCIAGWARALKSSALVGAAQTVAVPGAGGGGGRWGNGSAGCLKAVGDSEEGICGVCQFRGISEMLI